MIFHQTKKQIKPMYYNWLTAQAINDDITVEQKGCHKGTQETNDQLYIYIPTHSKRDKDKVLYTMKEWMITILYKNITLTLFLERVKTSVSMRERGEDGWLKGLGHCYNDP